MSANAGPESPWDPKVLSIHERFLGLQGLVLQHKATQVYRLEEDVLSPHFTEEGDPIFDMHVESDRDMADTSRRYMEGVLSHGLVDGIRGEVLAAPLVETVFVS